MAETPSYQPFRGMTFPPNGGCTRPRGTSKGMIIALVAAAIAAGVALLRGGSLDSLAQTPFRWLPLLFVALVVQIAFVILDPTWISQAGALLVILGSITVVAVFLTLNRRLPGTTIAALGLLMNVLVIGINGAMPVSEDAARTIGAEEGALRSPGIKHERMDDDTRLSFLADIIPIPVIDSVISPGDVVLALGLVVLTYKRTRAGDLRGSRSRSQTT